MSPDPDYDLISDEDLSRQMMPRIAVPDHESWPAGDLALSGALQDRISLLRDQRYGEGQRQLADLSRRFAAKLSAKGADVRLIEIAGLHHFSITHFLSDSSAPLRRAILELVH